MVPPNNLRPDLSGKFVNETQYRGMIGSLMYLTTSRLDIQFSTCLCARYQANPKESYPIAVKRIFTYLKGTPSLGLWYPKCLGFDLKGYSDSDYAGCNMDRKSTSGACQLLGGKLVCWSAKKHQSVAMSSAESEYVAAAGYHVLKGDIELHFIPTQYQLANIFTKPLDEPTFKRLIVEIEPVTLGKPESPNPFLPAIQVDFTFKEIAFTTNNEVALLYPSHPNQEYFKDVSNFIYKCCLKEAFTRALTQYKEYLSEFWYTKKTLADSKVWVSTPTGGIRGEIGYNGEIRVKETLKKSCLPPRWRLLMVQIIQCLGGKTSGLDQISNKDATILYYLTNEVQVDYAKLIWEDLIHKLNKKTREKIVPYPRFLSLLLKHTILEYENEELTINPTQVFSVYNLTLKLNQPEEPPFTDHMKAIYNLDVPVDSKAPKPSSQTEEVPQGKKPGAKSGLRRKRSSKHTSESTIEASKS
ncbi:hypothetical protein Tco_0330940 [Tanacetum coccineum]